MWRFSPAITFVAFVALSIFMGIWVTSKQDDVAIKETPRVSDFEIDPFESLGNVVFLEGEPGKMFLIYEKPGAPALKVELVLDGMSFCGKQSGDLSLCANMIFDQGMRVFIKGNYIAENVVSIVELRQVD